MGKKKKLFGWRSKVKEYTLTLGAGIHITDLVNWHHRIETKNSLCVWKQKSH